MISDNVLADFDERLEKDLEEALRYVGMVSSPILPSAFDNIFESYIDSDTTYTGYNFNKKKNKKRKKGLYQKRRSKKKYHGK